MALIIRKTEEGVRIEGDPPDEHVFSARHLEREIASGLIEVIIALRTDDGPHYYKVQGFEPVVNDETGETTSNLTALVATRTEVRGG